MKAVICLLALIGTANAGFLLGGLGLGIGGGLGGELIGGGGGAVNSGWSSGGGWSNGGGWSSGYGGGWSSGKSILVPETKIVKIIEAPAPIIQPAPIQIVKVIREAPVVAPAWKFVKVIGPSYGHGWA